MSPSTAALIPAAGLSSRMGRPKPLLPFGKSTAIELLIGSLREAGIGEIVLVLGPGGEAVAEVLADTPLTLVWNCAPQSDMAASLRLGLEHLGAEATGVLVALADHPLVAAATVATLRARHEQEPATILIPTCQGRNGHPILLPRAILGELAQLPTLREVVRRDSGRVRHLPVDDPGILLDLDTPEDYLAGLQHHARP
jgi:molybdenum cofactor cytidylyltransferase